MRADPGAPRGAGLARSTSNGLATALIVAALSTGCANPFSPEGDEVGVYKGEQDPLTEKPAAQRQEALRERFEIIQSR